MLNDVVSVSAGEEHSLALKNDGSIWVVGNNGYGQLGKYNSTSISTFEKIMDNVKSISAGHHHS